MLESEIWIGLFKVFIINIILSGDNAVVIALACRNLQGKAQKQAVFWGSFGAIALRAALTFAAVWLLHVPMLELIGGLLLIWISLKLLRDDHQSEHLKGGTSISEAIRTIIIADLVMSLDNVVAVAGAANGNLFVIIVGLATSIPLIVWGSQLLMKLMQRFPVIILLGAALLGYTAGEMIEEDKWIAPLFDFDLMWGHYFLPVLLAICILVVGKINLRRSAIKKQS